MKTLIICPKCLQWGKKEVLAEVDEEMNIIVKRYHVHTTNVVATTYIISCTSGHQVFRRNNEGTAYIV
jgi:hypothetical protein